MSKMEISWIVHVHPYADNNKFISPRNTQRKAI
jgi:hypothetical protein